MKPCYRTVKQKHQGWLGVNLFTQGNQQYFTDNQTSLGIERSCLFFPLNASMSHLKPSIDRHDVENKRYTHQCNYYIIIKDQMVDG